MPTLLMPSSFSSACTHKICNIHRCQHVLLDPTALVNPEVLACSPSQQETGRYCCSLVVKGHEASPANLYPHGTISCNDMLM